MAVSLNLRKRKYKFLKLFMKNDDVVRLFFKDYLYTLDSIDVDSCESVQTDYIWTMWLQDEMPEICGLCLDSIKKFYPNAVVITERNLNDYLNIPDYIWEKYKNGIIRPSHFSDLVRSCLLAQYGGTWIDATCFLTQPIPNYILKSEFFIFKDFSENALSSYFIHSVKNNFMMLALKNFQLEYWKKEIFALDYFIFHKFLRYISKTNPKAKEIWQNIPVGLNFNTKLMFKVLFKNYDKDVYDWLSQTSFIHKLTYKQMNKDTNAKSLYRYLIENYRKSKTD